MSADDRGHGAWSRYLGGPVPRRSERFLEGERSRVDDALRQAQRDARDIAAATRTPPIFEVKRNDRLTELGTVPGDGILFGTPDRNGYRGYTDKNGRWRVEFVGRPAAPPPTFVHPERPHDTGLAIDINTPSGLLPTMLDQMVANILSTVRKNMTPQNGQTMTSTEKTPVEIQREIVLTVKNHRVSPINLDEMRALLEAAAELGAPGDIKPNYGVLRFPMVDGIPGDDRISATTYEVRSQTMDEGFRVYGTVLDGDVRRPARHWKGSSEVYLWKSLRKGWERTDLPFTEGPTRPEAASAPEDQGVTFGHLDGRLLPGTNWGGAPAVQHVDGTVWALYGGPDEKAHWSNAGKESLVAKAFVFGNAPADGSADAPTVVDTTPVLGYINGAQISDGGYVARRYGNVPAIRYDDNTVWAFGRATNGTPAGWRMAGVASFIAKAFVAGVAPSAAPGADLAAGWEYGMVTIAGMLHQARRRPSQAHHQATELQFRESGHQRAWKAATGSRARSTFVADES